MIRDVGTYIYTYSEWFYSPRTFAYSSRVNVYARTDGRHGARPRQPYTTRARRQYVCEQYVRMHIPLGGEFSMSRARSSIRTARRLQHTVWSVCARREIPLPPSPTRARTRRRLSRYHTPTPMMWVTRSSASVPGTTVVKPKMFASHRRRRRLSLTTRVHIIILLYRRYYTSEYAYSLYTYARAVEIYSRTRRILNDFENDLWPPVVSRTLECRLARPRAVGEMRRATVVWRARQRDDGVRHRARAVRSREYDSLLSCYRRVDGVFRTRADDNVDRRTTVPRATPHRRFVGQEEPGTPADRRNPLGLNATQSARERSSSYAQAYHATMWYAVWGAAKINLRNRQHTLIIAFVLRLTRSTSTTIIRP